MRVSSTIKDKLEKRSLICNRESIKTVVLAELYNCSFGRVA